MTDEQEEFEQRHIKRDGCYQPVATMTDPCVEAVAPTIGKEKCWCGHPSCKTWWLTGIGSFCQGSGFSEEEADRIIAAMHSASPTPALTEAAQAILDRMTGTYKARNGRMASIEGDDGEKCWIVHSDDIENLRHALSASPTPASVTEEIVKVLEDEAANHPTLTNLSFYAVPIAQRIAAILAMSTISKAGDDK